MISIDPATVILIVTSLLDRSVTNVMTALVLSLFRIEM